MPPTIPDFPSREKINKIFNMGKIKITEEVTEKEVIKETQVQLILRRFKYDKSFSLNEAIGKIIALLEEDHPVESKYVERCACDKHDIVDLDKFTEDRPAESE